MVFFVVGNLGTNRTRETWPATGWIKLVPRWKEGLTGHYININPWFKMIPKWACKGSFCSIFLGHSIGFWTQTYFKFLLTWLVIRTWINNRVNGLININMAIAIRILLEIVLMVFLSRNKVLKWQQLNRQRLTVLLRHFLENFLDDWQVIYISIVNTRTVLGSHIIPLFVFA